jgi:predicted GIY-YIG superfamily endonuclease
MQAYANISYADSDNTHERMITVTIDDDGRLCLDGHPVIGRVFIGGRKGFHTAQAHWFWFSDDDTTRILAHWKEALAPRRLVVTTIGHLLSGAMRPGFRSRNLLYVIRDEGQQVLYVGQTTIAVHKRLNQHIKHATSVFGAYFRQHVPTAYGWQVDVYESFTDLNADELMLIQQLQPLLNIRMNQGGHS